MIALSHVSRVLSGAVLTHDLIGRSGPAEDTFRIMIATDNHIGYAERDPVRGQDSINTFREILQLAVKHDVSACSSTSVCLAKVPSLS